MPEIATKHLQGRIDGDAMVLTLIIPRIQDEQTAQAIHDELSKLLSAHPVKSVLLDMDNIRYISSVAFRPLLALRKKVQERQGRLILYRVSKVIGDIFYSTRMVDPSGETTALFEISTDLDSAKKMLVSV